MIAVINLAEAIYLCWDYTASVNPYILTRYLASMYTLPYSEEIFTTLN